MKSLRILMIGNSFSICVGHCLPQIVQTAGYSIKLVSAYIGGCSLERHWQNIETLGNKPYDYDVWYIANGTVIHDYPPRPAKGELPDFLTDDQYDVITIQQASHFSWQPETYQPYADKLLRKVRHCQPDAEILVQQTWAYRIQDKRFNGEWSIDQTEMYRRADAAYRKLADTYGLRRIPTGTAVQISREKTVNPYRKVSEAELKQYVWPDLPKNSGDVVGKMWWGKDGQSGEMVICQDNIHLNARGEYLQACVWFGVLYGEDPRNIQWNSPDLSDSDCKFLRECAALAIEQENNKKS